MHINLPESLIVLPGAVTPKGVHLMANRHSSMVDSPRPSFQVHWPAQHSTRCETSDHHFVACLDSIKPPPLTLRTQWEEQHSAHEHTKLGVAVRSTKENCFCSWLRVAQLCCCWQVHKPPYYLSWESILRSVLSLPCLSLCPPSLYPLKSAVNIESYQ